jgi:hypothetical protein
VSKTETSDKNFRFANNYSIISLLVGGPIGGAILDASNGSWLIPAFVAGGTVLFGVFLILVSHARVKN